jgi:hypothetical protein
MIQAPGNGTRLAAARRYFKHPATGLFHRRNESIEGLAYFLIIDAQAAFDGHGNGDGEAHCCHAFGDAPGLRHQTGPELPLLHAIGRATAVQIDLDITEILSDAGGISQLRRIGTAELQGHRLFHGRESKKPFAMPEPDGTLLAAPQLELRHGDLIVRTIPWRAGTVRMQAPLADGTVLGREARVPAGQPYTCLLASGLSATDVQGVTALAELRVGERILRTRTSTAPAR